MTQLFGSQQADLLNGKWLHTGICKAAVLSLSVLLWACSASHSRVDNTALASSLFEAFNRHDWKAMADHYADNAKFLDPSLGKQFVTQSRAEVQAKYAAMQKLFPDIKDDVKAMYASDETVVVEFISTGAMGDSLAFELPIVSVLTFSDGLIVRDATYYDLENE